MTKCVKNSYFITSIFSPVIFTNTSSISEGWASWSVRGEAAGGEGVTVAVGGMVVAGLEVAMTRCRQHTLSFRKEQSVFLHRGLAALSPGFQFRDESTFGTKSVWSGWPA